ncbi:MAG: class I SAM-dependent methyltransferase [Candidatus Omnitrophica bacterium]|nr:class I SAM-dependent methyltransferase [Candidatus Omnitrophota bacterium]
MLKGVHYRSRLFYRAQTLIKLGKGHGDRFRIAADYITPGSRVIDICSGPGDLRHYLPPGCRYSCLEASPSFVRHLDRRNIPCLRHNLHLPLAPLQVKADVATMLISLCHFPRERALSLLAELTQLAPTVIIVEEVTQKKRPAASPLQAVMNYLSATAYTGAYEIMTGEEFCELVQEAGYRYERINERYAVGIFSVQEEKLRAKDLAK